MANHDNRNRSPTLERIILARLDELDRLNELEGLYGLSKDEWILHLTHIKDITSDQLANLKSFLRSGFKKDAVIGPLITQEAENTPLQSETVNKSKACASTTTRGSGQ